MSFIRLDLGFGEISPQQEDVSVSQSAKGSEVLIWHLALPPSTTEEQALASYKRLLRNSRMVRDATRKILILSGDVPASVAGYTVERMRSTARMIYVQSREGKLLRVSGLGPDPQVVSSQGDYRAMTLCFSCGLVNGASQVCPSCGDSRIAVVYV